MVPRVRHSKTEARRVDCERAPMGIGQWRSKKGFKLSSTKGHALVTSLADESIMAAREVRS